MYSYVLAIVIKKYFEECMQNITASPKALLNLSKSLSSEWLKKALTCSVFFYHRDFYLPSNCCIYFNAAIVFNIDCGKRKYKITEVLILEGDMGICGVAVPLIFVVRCCGE